MHAHSGIHTYKHAHPHMSMHIQLHACMHTCTHPHADVAPRQLNLMCSVYTVPGSSVNPEALPPQFVFTFAEMQYIL